jgi:CDP-2,3-bis-(O-geranylgeranyl)-sn-glycerol synthase
MHLRPILQLLLLLGFANGAPVLLNRLFGRRLAYSLDAGLILPDRQPLFGSSTSIRGVVVALLATTLAAPALNLDWRIGLTVSALAMAGDLLSSFSKRRLRLPAGSRATGLDQVPESLLPTLACRHALALTTSDILATVVLFFLGEILLSLLFYKLRLRERPY